MFDVDGFWRELQIIMEIVTGTYQTDERQACKHDRQDYQF